MFIVLGEDREHFGSGNTLKEAFDSLQDSTYGENSIENCRFFEAVEIEVEHKIIRKDVVKSISKREKGCENG